ncbi:hypothetical protein KR018_010426, partial [Drosophila ironensis]
QKPYPDGRPLVSDTCHRDPGKDTSGPKLAELIRERFANAKVIMRIQPDEPALIQQELRRLLERKEVRVIFTSGGTGFAPRDCTPEATRPLLEKECPQLALAIALGSLKKTKLAALSRGLCGIAGNKLIINLPGSQKAVVECFESVHDLLPHAVHLLSDDIALVRRTHEELQGAAPGEGRQEQEHVCPHRTGAGSDSDRNSPFPMLPVAEVLALIFERVRPVEQSQSPVWEMRSAVNIPPFRASIKDGYAMQSSGFSGSKRVLGTIAAGDVPNSMPMAEDECFKINTGAPLPLHADCVVQVEDTRLLQRDSGGAECLVDILVAPQSGLDVRPVGHDLKTQDPVFPVKDTSPVVIESLLASVGSCAKARKPLVAILSTGSELQEPGSVPEPGKIFDSNTTMLQQLLRYFGFECIQSRVSGDDPDKVREGLSKLCEEADFVICSGGVSMGDKDYVKPALRSLKFQIHCGRVNMKPGKPMTFATRDNKYFFGLPGNPVSSFVTFHLFALPAIRWAAGWERARCTLPQINVKLLHDLRLDVRPEYVRASVISKGGELYASVTGDQISSRLQSIVGADVLIHLPGRSNDRPVAKAGQVFEASVLRYDFISKYE